MKTSQLNLPLPWTSKEEDGIRDSFDFLQSHHEMRVPTLKCKWFKWDFLSFKTNQSYSFVFSFPSKSRLMMSKYVKISIKTLIILLFSSIEQTHFLSWWVFSLCHLILDPFFKTHAVPCHHPRTTDAWWLNLKFFTAQIPNRKSCKMYENLSFLQKKWLSNVKSRTLSR